MKLDPKREVLVFRAVKELGEATREEILEHLKESAPDMQDSEILRYLHKFKAKRVFTIRTRAGKEVWAITNIPPWYISGMMDILNLPASKDLKLEIEALTERLKAEGFRPTPPQSPWNSYVRLELTFECLDPILGGWLTSNERELAFPRKNGELYIPPNWFRGMIRDNQALMETAALQYHTAIGVGEFEQQPKTYKQKLKVKTGITEFEAVPAGSKFKIKLSVPLKGSKIASIGDLERFFGLVAETPIRGLGANSHALGGRVKLVQLKELA